MKKAQWKKDPRERAFGKDPREVLNDEMAAALKKANDIIQDQNRKIGWMKAHIEEKTERIQTLNKYRHAYMRLRQIGVVLADAEEFKHLQGEDMDVFCGLDLGPKTPTGLRDMVERQVNAQFQKALQHSMLYGNSVSQIFYDDTTDALTWLPPQK